MPAFGFYAGLGFGPYPIVTASGLTGPLTIRTQTFTIFLIDVTVRGI